MLRIFTIYAAVSFPIIFVLTLVITSNWDAITLKERIWEGIKYGVIFEAIWSIICLGANFIVKPLLTRI